MQGTLFLDTTPMESHVGDRSKLYCKNQPVSPASTIHIQRKCVSIAPPLNIGKVGEIIKHSSKVLTSLTSPLMNSTNLPFCLLLQTLTLAYQLLNVTRPGCFKDCWLRVPPGTNSQLSVTASPVILRSNLTSPFTSCPKSNVAMTPYLTSIPVCFGKLLQNLQDSLCRNTELPRLQ